MPSFVNSPSGIPVPSSAGAGGSQAGSSEMGGSTMSASRQKQTKRDEVSSSQASRGVGRNWVDCSVAAMEKKQEELERKTRSRRSSMLDRRSKDLLLT